jgi:hypothetical protein
MAFIHMFDVLAIISPPVMGDSNPSKMYVKQLLEIILTRFDQDNEQSEQHLSHNI